MVGVSWQTGYVRDKWLKIQHLKNGWRGRSSEEKEKLFMKGGSRVPTWNSFDDDLASASNDVFGIVFIFVVEV